MNNDKKIKPGTLIRIIGNLKQTVDEHGDADELYQMHGNIYVVDEVRKRDIIIINPQNKCRYHFSPENIKLLQIKTIELKKELFNINLLDI